MLDFKVIKFNSDTKHRKQWFTGLSFSHPAKMVLPLQLWLIDNFTKEGETILDPMSGSGTILVACSLGRHVITVELEDKFVQMQKGNWAKIQQRGTQLGYQMGTCQILQGDARNLTGILADKIITSPPYNDSPVGGGLNTKPPREGHNDQTGRSMSPSQAGAGKYDKIISSPPYAEVSHHSDNPAELEYLRPGRSARIAGTAGERPDNLGNLPYGSIDKVITSPPYEEAMGKKHHSPRADKLAEEKSNPVTYTDKVDSIISSPPYEGSVSASTGGERDQSSARKREKRLQGKGFDPAKYQGGVGRNLEVDFQYSKDNENIGNLKSDTYLSAMLQVYQQCFLVLKDSGLLILVVKSFIRNKKIVDLAADTIKLCESAGFTFQDRWYRELTQQSFWRALYSKKYPDVEPIKYEDVLIFSKDSS